MCHSKMSNLGGSRSKFTVFDFMNWVTKLSVSLTRDLRLIEAADAEAKYDLRKMKARIIDKETLKSSQPDLNAMRDKYEKFFYDVILGQHMEWLSQRSSTDEEPYYAGILRAKAWDFIIDINSTFDMERAYSPEDFLQKRNRFFARLSKKRAAAMRAAREYVEYGIANEHIRTELAEKATVGPITLIPEGGIQEEEMARAAKTVQLALEIVGKGPYKAVLTPMVAIVTNRSERLQSAHYQADDDRMLIRPLGSYRPDTFIHELGHRYYYRVMSSNARYYWGQIIKGDQVVITQDEVDEWTRIVRQQFDLMAQPTSAEGKVWVNTKEMYNSAAQRFRDLHSDDPLLDAKISYFMRHDYYWVTDNTPEKWGNFHKFISQNLVGQPLMKHFITEYGNTKPEEAYSEIFMNLHMGRTVEPFMLSIFQKVSGVRP